MKKILRKKIKKSLEITIFENKTKRDEKTFNIFGNFDFLYQ